MVPSPSMRNPSVVGRFLLLSAVVTGCVRAVVPAPPPRDVTLGSLKAPARDYAAAGVSPCEVDPATVAGDITAVNALLESFLAQTSAAPDAAWSGDQIKLLDDAQRALPPVLDAQDATLSALAACQLPDKHPAKELAGRSAELSRDARKRLEAAPSLLVVLYKRKAIEDWKAKELAARETERKNWCPPKPSPLPEIYYAWEGEPGHIEWLFCDGSKVVTRPGAEPEHTPPPEELRRASRSIQTPSGYVKAAKRFPDSEIRRPPQRM